MNWGTHTQPAVETLKFYNVFFFATSKVYSHIISTPGKNRGFEVNLDFVFVFLSTVSEIK